MATPTIPSYVLRTAIRAVKRAMSLDDSRPHLSCLRLDVTAKKLVTAATNGHWLARFTWEHDDEPPFPEASFVIPAENALELARWLRSKREESDGCDYCGNTERVRVERPPVEIDVEHRVIRCDRDRFALSIYDGSARPPDLDAVIPPETDAPFAGLIATNLVRHIARSFQDAYGDTPAMRFRGADVEGPIRISTHAPSQPERSLLVVCMPVKGT